MKKNKIYLVGFMGAGKTTVGRLLSLESGIPFYDLDECIEIECGMSISDIFSKRGEAYFREIESNMLREITENKDRFIMSTGGGVVLREENREVMKKNGVTIYLKGEVENLFQRIKKETNRPLLDVENPFERFKSLFEQRSSLYDISSDYTVYTDNKSPNMIVSEILRLIEIK